MRNSQVAGVFKVIEQYRFYDPAARDAMCVGDGINSLPQRGWERDSNAQARWLLSRLSHLARNHEGNCMVLQYLCGTLFILLQGNDLAWSVMNYGDLIRSARLAKGWSQPDLADRVGTSITTVSHWETGKTRPGVEDVNQLASALQLSPEQLLIAMGVVLSPMPEARLPRDIVDALRILSPEQMEAARLVLRGLASLPASRPEKDRR